jgi:hypothetical protein
MPKLFMMNRMGTVGAFSSRFAKKEHACTCNLLGQSQKPAKKLEEKLAK